MVFDRLETLSKSLIQHGPNNDRVYLMKVHPDERSIESLIDQLYNLAILKRYTKIFAKVPDHLQQLFLEHNFKLEATVPGLYRQKEQACFLGKYFNAKRGFLTKTEKQIINEVKDSALVAPKISDDELPKGYATVKLGRK